MTDNISEKDKKDWKNFISSNEKLANKDGFIGTFHKNHKANIMNLCKSCHNKETKNDTKKRRTKTTKGMRLLERE